MIKALIFDLDNTLIDRRRAFIEGMNTILHHYFNDEDEIKRMIKDILIWDKDGTVERIDVFRQLKEKYNFRECEPENLDEDWKKLSGSSCYLYDDVRTTLSKLKEKYFIAVLSNGATASQRRKMEKINIYDLLDYSLIASEYTCWKPNKEIFLYVAEQLKVKPDECVYIGDNYDIDVCGSRNAGMIPIYVNRKNEEHPDVKNIKEINELLNIF